MFKNPRFLPVLIVLTCLVLSAITPTSVIGSTLFASPVPAPTPPQGPGLTPAEWQIVQNLIMVVIMVGAPVAIAYLVSQVAMVIDFFKNTQDAKWMLVREAVRSAVLAAEQLGLTEQLGEWGNDKFSYALAFVQDYLDAQGIKIDLGDYIDVITGMIEAEVLRQFPKDGAG